MEGLGIKYDVYLRLLDFLFMLIELFSLQVMADPKFQVEGVAPHQPFFFSENYVE